MIFVYGAIVWIALLGFFWAMCVLAGRADTRTGRK